MAGTTIFNIPPEILSNVFTHLVATQFHPSLFRSSLQNTIQNLVNVSHVNTRFREVAVYDPHLWAMLAFIGGVHEDLFEFILIRSAPLPFCLSFVEDETLPSYNDTKAWMLALDQAARLGSLSIEVAAGFEGVYAKAVLATGFPALQQCIVQFQGRRNVQLDPRAQPLFANAAPLLRSLNLTNCYISPTSCHFPKMQSVAIRYLGASLCGPPSPSLYTCHRWNPQFRHLRSLIIWNCLAHPRSLTVRCLKLPALESLVAAAPLSFCHQLAEILVYPANCACNITVLFPRVSSVADAKSGALGAIAFLSLGEYCHCMITMGDSVPTLRLIRPNGQCVVLRFNFRHLVIPSRGPLAHPSRRRAMNTASLPLSITRVLEPLHMFCFQLWDTLATTLSSNIQHVSTLHLSMPRLDSPDLVYLPPLLTAMPIVRTISFDQPAVFASPSFHYISTLCPGLSEVTQVTVRITEEAWNDDKKFGLRDFLRGRLNRGAPLREVLFVVSPRIVQSLGFASSERINLVLADISKHIPSCIIVKWLER